MNAKGQRFKVGDIVKLKSGGPTMTVSALPGQVYGRGAVDYECKWFSGAKNNTAYFPPAVLEPAEPPSTPKKG